MNPCVCLCRSQRVRAARPRVLTRLFLLPSVSSPQRTPPRSGIPPSPVARIARSWRRRGCDRTSSSRAWSVGSRLDSISCTGHSRDQAVDGTSDNGWRGCSVVHGENCSTFTRDHAGVPSTSGGLDCVELIQFIFGRMVRLRQQTHRRSAQGLLSHMGCACTNTQRGSINGEIQTGEKGEEVGIG